MASIGFSETNGAAPTGVTTNGIPSVQFAAADVASAANVSTNNQVQPGNYSYEKWIRAQVTQAAATGFTAFSVYFDNDVLDALGGTGNITVKYGVNPASYATPVNAASTVAVNPISGDTSAPGTNVNAPANALNAYSGYIVLQAYVGASAPAGACSFPADFLSLLYSWN